MSTKIYIGLEDKIFKMNFISVISFKSEPYKNLNYLPHQCYLKKPINNRNQNNMAHAK